MSLFLVYCLATVQPLRYKPVWVQTASLLSMLLPGEEGTYDSNVFNIINKTDYRCPLDVCQNASAKVTNIATSSCSFKTGTPTFLASRKQEVVLIPQV